MGDEGDRVWGDTMPEAYERWLVPPAGGRRRIRAAEPPPAGYPVNLPSRMRWTSIRPSSWAPDSTISGSGTKSRTGERSS
jgi:hypothetical protein